MKSKQYKFTAKGDLLEFIEKRMKAGSTISKIVESILNQCEDARKEKSVLRGYLDTCRKNELTPEVSDILDILGIEKIPEDPKITDKSVESLRHAYKKYPEDVRRYLMRIKEDSPDKYDLLYALLFGPNGS